MKPPRETAASVAAKAEPDFEAVLSSDRLRKPFQVPDSSSSSSLPCPHWWTWTLKEFLEQQFCAENLNFYLFVERYKAVVDKDRARIGRDLFDQHFSDAAAEPVNVESAILKAVKEAVAAADFRADLFDAAQYHVFHIMKFDVWPRFQKSDASGAATLDPKGSVRKKDGPPDAKPESKRKSILPWKVMRNRKKESTASTASSSTSARGPNPAPVANFLGVDEGDGDDKKRGWREIKQHSMPSQVCPSYPLCPTLVHTPGAILDRGQCPSRTLHLRVQCSERELDLGPGLGGGPPQPRRPLHQRHRRRPRLRPRGPGRRAGDALPHRPHPHHPRLAPPALPSQSPQPHLRRAP